VECRKRTGLPRRRWLPPSDRTPCGTPLSTSNAHALMVLLQAGRLGERVTQQALGIALGIDKSNVTRLCAKMEAAGHIQQRRCPNDGRARLVALTPEGVRLATRVDKASRERFRQLLAALPGRSDQARVVAALDTLNAAIAATCALKEAA
jgi:DNA-binding MarR family transcriptional regulator